MPCILQASKSGPALPPTALCGLPGEAGVLSGCFVLLKDDWSAEIQKSDRRFVCQGTSPRHCAGQGATVWGLRLAQDDGLVQVVPANFLGEAIPVGTKRGSRTRITQATATMVGWSWECCTASTVWRGVSKAGARRPGPCPATMRAWSPTRRALQGLAWDKHALLPICCKSAQADWKKGGGKEGALDQHNIFILCKNA